ncbi:MAG: PilZ domain-containing protein [Armatimonadetes bacterium]|nr:PilZ domain-containing protein [Armatimonadota bacterium]
MVTALNHSLADSNNSDLWERRRGVRYPCSFEVECESGGRRYRARVLDISPGGMRLQFPEQAPSDDWELTVASLPEADFLGGRKLMCRTAWLSASELGVSFEAGAECLESYWPSFHPASRRRELRLPANLPVRILTTDSRLLSEGQAVNFSVGGLSVPTDADLRIGQLVAVEVGPWGPLPTIRRLAQVCSIEPVSSGHGQRACGLRFHGGSLRDSRLLVLYFRRLQKEVQLEESYV